MRMKALVLGLMVIGSVVIFVLGVMVGTNVTVAPPADSIAAGGRGKIGTPAAARREEIPLPPKGQQVKNEEMTFYDTLAGQKKPETVAAGQAQVPVAAPVAVSTAGTPAAPAAPAQPIAVVGGPAPAFKAEPAAPAARETAPVEKVAAAKKEPAAAPAQGARKEPAAEPAKPAAKVKGPRFSVQVMRTDDAGEARITAENLTKNGFPATVLASGKYHFVRVGTGLAEAEARKLQKEIAAKTRHKDAFAVKD